MKFRQAENYPVDLYYVMDMSNSMKDDKARLALLGDLLGQYIVHCDDAVMHVFVAVLLCSLAVLDNIRVMLIVWRLRGNIIRTALCWIV